MQGISDIKIIGIDESRPPIIQKQPYIDIFFKLSHQAPSDWCKDFNNLLTKDTASPKIKEKEGIIIEAWVRKPDEIFDLLDRLKKTVTECSRQYIQRIELSAQQARNKNNTQVDDNSEQSQLNKLIASLEFDTIDE